MPAEASGAQTAAGGQQRLGDVLGLAASYLQDKGSPTARLDAEVLLADVLDCDRVRLYLDFDKPLATHELGTYRTAVARRAAGTPVSRLVGHREFWSLELQVTPDVLVPRPETEVLVEAALERLPTDKPATVLELGTGSGAVILALATERPQARLVATDVSRAALDVARSNGEAQYLVERIDWRAGDLFAPVADERFDLILMNPPYLSAADLAAAPPEVRDHDPRQALDGGADGLDVYRRLLAEAPAHLRSDGALLVEIGAGQGVAVTELADSAGLVVNEKRDDLSGITRVLGLDTKSGTV